MGKFSWEGTTSEGIDRKGTIEAGNEDAARGKLRSQNITVKKLKKAGMGQININLTFGNIQMVESIIKDKKRVLPCAVYLQGEYGIKDLFVGVLAKLGSGGMEKVVELDLNDTERSALDKSAESVRGLVATLESSEL